jgi:hypothetical protein
LKDFEFSRAVHLDVKYKVKRKGYNEQNNGSNVSDKEIIGDNESNQKGLQEDNLLIKRKKPVSSLFTNLILIFLSLSILIFVLLLILAIFRLFLIESINKIIIGLSIF